jgi:ADP-heptose:LPS heptosyltransferase
MLENRSIVKIGKTVMKSLVPIVYGKFLRRESRIEKSSNVPRRILLINGFHIGDVVIATSVIPVLKRAYPDVEIGFLTGSWSKMVVEKNTDVKYLHCIDHWLNNRGPIGMFQKYLQYHKSLRQALAEIRTVKYDWAICLITNFPDLMDVAWRAKIPNRITFRRSMFANLASVVVDEPDGLFIHQADRLAETLRALPLDQNLLQFRKPVLAPSDDKSIQEVLNILKVSRIQDARYRIVHMGSGATLRELPASFWRTLARSLTPDCKLLFTGRGARENRNILQAIEGLDNCINVCDRLSWDGFVAAVRYAEVLYGVESMAGHVASAVGTRCIVVYSGTAGVARWRPEGPSSIVFTNHVSCAPCYRSKGCDDMTCIKGIRSEELVRLIPSENA